MSFQIATDSTTDLTAPLYRGHSITVLPLHFVIDGTEFLDGWSSMTPEEFFGLLRSGKTSTTSAVNFGQFIEAFTPILERGEDILYPVSYTHLGICICSNDMHDSDLLFDVSV